MILALPACGGGKSPTAPEQVTLALTPGTDFLATGQSAELTLIGTRANGTQETMQATWGSDNTQVATVENGHLVGVRPGQATIYAECTHGRATRVVRVVPEYAGSWAGAYSLGACSATGDFATEQMCDEFPAGSQAPLGLRLSRSREHVTGTVMLGSLSGDTAGDIAIPGNLALAGSVRYEEEGISAQIALSEWDTMAERDQMTGHFVETWTVTGATGSLRLTCDIATMNRTSSSFALQFIRPSAPPRNTRGARLANAIGIRR
jgi:hypothetical protein